MKSALLVVDVQSGVFGSANPPFQSDAVIHNINALVRHANAQGLKTVLIQHQIPGMLEPDSPAWQLYAGLTDAEQRINIRKHTPDAFQGTDLADRLAEESIEHLIICGYASDFCIDRTAFSAASRGYQVSLVEDAHTTHDKPHLDARSIIAHHSFTLSKHPNIGLTSTRALTQGAPDQETVES